VNKFLSMELERANLSIPFYCMKYVNIKQLFADFFSCSRMNLPRMLERVGLEFQGTPHCGIDDTRNIAKLAKALSESVSYFAYLLI
jgi:3'-5' exoribonuclease 1